MGNTHATENKWASRRDRIREILFWSVTKSKKMDVENGAIIKQYKILSAIGKGGMREVYLAEDINLDRKVAFFSIFFPFASLQNR
jgi:serine/threonine protein kinase